MSRTRTITLTLGSVAAGAILATGVTGLALADDTATPSAGSSVSAPADAGPGMRGADGMRGGHRGPGGMHGMRGGPMGEALHGELVVKADDGTISTVRQISGTVTAVSDTSITVKAEDGYTATFAVTEDTVVRTGLPSRDRDGAQPTDQSISDVSVGDVARVHGTVSGDAATAEHVHALTAEQAAALDAAREEHRAARDAGSGAAPSGTTQSS
jgi:hypothetical protein